MTDLISFENLSNLLILIFLQAVLGFDNLLYISIQSKYAPEHMQSKVRFWGIIMAVTLRVVLLFTMIKLIDAFKEPFYIFNMPGFIEGGINFSTLIFIIGGVFIIYTAFKEIIHMLSIKDLDIDSKHKSSKSAASVITLIVVINLIFSFDSILSALAITDVFILLAIAIITSGIAMLILVDSITVFIQKNRMYEVLGLFILLIVGVVLLGEAGPAAAHAMDDKTLQIKFFGYDLLPMSKTTFYFSVIVLVCVELIQSGYQRKLTLKRNREQQENQ